MPLIFYHRQEHSYFAEAREYLSEFVDNRVVSQEEFEKLENRPFLCWQCALIHGAGCSEPLGILNSTEESS